MSRIEEIINEIKKLDNELLAEIQKKEEEFFIKLRERKFSLNRRQENIKKNL